MQIFTIKTNNTINLTKYLIWGRIVERFYFLLYIIMSLDNLKLLMTNQKIEQEKIP